MATLTEARPTAPVRRITLSNGLTVLVQEEHTAPLAAVWCWYKVGSKDEGPGLTGVSHWVEHMNFKGTTNIPRDQVKGIIEQFGGNWNGYTWIDLTTYLETATRDALDRMLFIEAERMTNCLYHPDDCESERTVIMSELQGGENDPNQLLDQQLTATAFTAHPYGHPTIGWLSDLQTMSRDDLYGHYRRYYVPNNATLVVVGDVDIDATLGRIEQHFGAIPTGQTPPRLRTIEPAQAGERRVCIRKEGTTGYLKVGYHAPAVTDPPFFPLLILDAVLTGAKGMNLWSSFKMPSSQRRARLYRRLVETGLASSVSGALLPTEQPFLYTVSVTATEGTRLAALEAVLLEELDRVRRDAITEAELAKAKRQLRARLVFDDDSITTISHQFGYFQTIATVDTYLTLPQRIATVTLEQVAAAARNLLADSNRTVGWFDPDPGMTPISNGGLSPTRTAFDNGVVVLAKRTPTRPAVTIDLSVRSGSVYDPADLPGTMFLLSRVIDRGTVARSADDIAEELDGRGIGWSSTVSRHALSIVCTCLSEDFEAVLALLADVVRSPSFPETEIATRKGEATTAIRQDEDNPAVRAVEELTALLFRDGHPYGRRTKGSVETIKAIRREHLVERHARYFAPSAVTVAVVGDVEVARALASAAEAFGGWRAPVPPPVLLPPVVPVEHRRRLVIPMMNKAQADVAYGFTAIARADPAYYACWLMNNALGQYSIGGRLGDSIRERQGMAYYVFSALEANVAEGALLIRAGVSPGNVDRAIASIDEELVRLTREGLTPKELAESRQYLIGSMPRMLETNAGIASFLQTAECFGLGLDYDLRLPHRLGSVTLEDTLAAARRVLDPERATIVIAGPYQK